eukprot:scaffold74389_cov34-Tisochrysis_lutea.AAC.3
MKHTGGKEYEQGGELKNKPVDLLTLTPETDVEVLVNQVRRVERDVSLVRAQRYWASQAVANSLAACFHATAERLIVRQEALISDARKPQLRKLIYKLIEKQVRQQGAILRHAYSTCGSSKKLPVLTCLCSLRPCAATPNSTISPLAACRNLMRMRASTSSRSFVRIFFLSPTVPSTNQEIGLSPGATTVPARCENCQNPARGGSFPRIRVLSLTCEMLAALVLCVPSVQGRRWWRCARCSPPPSSTLEMTLLTGVLPNLTRCDDCTGANVREGGRCATQLCASRSMEPINVHSRSHDLALWLMPPCCWV